MAAGLEAEPSATPSAPYRVKDAMADYLADYVARGGKAQSQTRMTIEAHINPGLGENLAARLTREQIRTWHRDIAATPARVRGRVRDVDARKAPLDPDTRRRRQATANRILTVLKAALNHARQEGRIVASGDAWGAVKRFRETDKARVRYLQDDEITRLVNSCLADVRSLVSAALLTGCRYGELAAMEVVDFDPHAQTVRVGRSKSGKPRYVALTEEGCSFFGQATEGRRGTARIFERDAIVKQATREAEAQTARVGWGNSDQFRHMRAACAAASLSPPISFHERRHTYASRLASKGVPMGVIAAQLGHSDTRMTERHYAHLSPSYVAETVRKSFGNLGIVQPTTVTKFRLQTG